MLSFFTRCIPVFVLLLDLSLALRVSSPRSAVVQKRRSFDLPIRRKAPSERISKRGTHSGSTGLGDSFDLTYTVPITIGNIKTAVDLDTGSSDLWVVSDACNTSVCQRAKVPPYPSANIKLAGGVVKLFYGDSSTETHASGPVAQDVVALAGLSMAQQAFAAISDTNSTIVSQGSNGIFGLGFPSSSRVQSTAINAKFNKSSTTDNLVLGTADEGPLLSRFVVSDSLEQPMFTVMLQRDTIDVSGSNGVLTVGKLPDGINNSSLTWVPVRLYRPEDGGISPPQFAPKEVYPSRWEIPIEGVTLDGQVLPVSNQSGFGSGLSVLLDTGNSIIRGPHDVVNSILEQVSPAFAADPNAVPTYPCSVPHNLGFQIGGKTFSIDPRDFLSQNKAGDATTCAVKHVVATDPPSRGTLFSWNLGDPFFRSNLVAFYYGNLTHPSVDPPRIGFLSMVPDNASSILQSDVSKAQANGGRFGSTSQAAPTSSVSNVLLTPTSFSFPRESALANTPNTKSHESSASSVFGHPSVVGHALCTVLLSTFLGNLLFLFI